MARRRRAARRRAHARRGRPARAEPPLGTALAHGRSVPRRAGLGRHRRDRPARHLLHRTAARRRLEDHERGHDVVSDLRFGEGSVVGRIGAGRAVRSQHHLRRDGRSHHRRRHQRRERDVQVGRRRQDVAAPRARRDEADSVDPRRSEGSEPRADRRAGKRPQAHGHARRVPQHGRRQDVDQDAVRRRPGRRAGDRLGVRQSEGDARDNGTALQRSARRRGGGGGGSAAARRAARRRRRAPSSSSPPTKGSRGRRSPATACRT